MLLLITIIILALIFPLIKFGKPTLLKRMFSTIFTITFWILITPSVLALSIIWAIGEKMWKSFTDTRLVKWIIIKKNAFKGLMLKKVF